MSDASQAVPRPWVVDDRYDDVALILGTDKLANDGWAVAETFRWPQHPGRAKANGDLIVRAVNAHDEMVAACKAAEEAIDDLLNRMIGSRLSGNTLMVNTVELTAAHSLLCDAVAKATGGAA